jgi:hypothetical protein
MFPFRRRPIDPRTGLPAPPIDHEVDLDADAEEDAAADGEPPPPTPQPSPPRQHPDPVESPTTGELPPYLPDNTPDASLVWPPSPALPVVVPDSPLPVLDEVVLELLGGWPWPSPSASYAESLWGSPQPSPGQQHDPAPSVRAVPPTHSTTDKFPTSQVRDAGAPEENDVGATSGGGRPDLPPRILSGPPDILSLPRPKPTDSDPFLIEEEAEVDMNFRPSYAAVAAPAVLPSDAGPMCRRLATGGLRVNARVPASRGRPTSPSHCRMVDMHVEALCEAGIVVPAKHSAYISYPFVIPKTNGQTRLIVDYSHLTKHIIEPASVHLPLFANVLRATHVPQGMFAVRIDLTHAFYSLPLHPKSRHLTNFRTSKGLFQFTRLPMGLSVSPRCLQRALQELFAPLFTKMCVSWIHVDDLLLIAPLHTLLETLPALLALCHAVNLIVNVNKSQLEPTQKIDYLGLNIDLTKRTFQPALKHLRRVSELLDMTEPLPEKLLPRVFGFLSFVLSITIRLYVPLRFPFVEAAAIFRWLIAKHLYVIPFAEPPAPPCYVDATPSQVAIFDSVTNLVIALPAFHSQATNEMRALLLAVALFGKTREFVTDASAVLTLYKRSHQLFAARAIVAALNVRLHWTCSLCNPADPPSRDLPGTYRMAYPLCHGQCNTAPERCWCASHQHLPPADHPFRSDAVKPPRMRRPVTSH